MFKRDATSANGKQGKKEKGSKNNIADNKK